MLDLEPNNLKALFRRGKLYSQVGELDRARTDLEKARNISPKDVEITKELTLLEKKEKDQNVQQKSFYSKMF